MVFAFLCFKSDPKYIYYIYNQKRLVIVECFLPARTIRDSHHDTSSGTAARKKSPSRQAGESQEDTTHRSGTVGGLPVLLVCSISWKMGISESHSSTGRDIWCSFWLHIAPKVSTSTFEGTSRPLSMFLGVRSQSSSSGHVLTTALSVGVLLCGGWRGVQKIQRLPYNPLPPSARCCHPWFSLCSLLFKHPGSFLQKITSSP